MAFVYGISFGVSLLLAALLFKRLKQHDANRWLFCNMATTALMFLLLGINIELPALLPNFIKVFSGSSGFLLLPIFFYLYVLELTGQKSKKHFLFFLPFAIHFIWHLIFYAGETASERLIFINGLMGIVPVFYWELWVGILLMLVQIVFPIMSLHLIKSHQQKILQRYANIEDIDLVWVQRLLWAILIVILISFSLIVPANLSNNLSFEFVFPIMFSLVAFQILYIGYYGINQSNVFSRIKISKPLAKIAFENIELEKSELEKETLINDIELVRIEKLKKHMLDSQIYKRNRLTIEQLSESIGWSVESLSQLINQGVGINFFDFINQYRVDEIIRQLEDSKNRNATLLNIAYENGFNSKTAFNNVFKKLTGKTPSQYRQSIVNRTKTV